MRQPYVSLVLVVLVTMVGGCNVQIGGESHPPAKQRVLDSGELSWDLREPPTRGQLGLPEGEDSIIYEYDEQQTIDARLRLPGDQTLAVDARYVAVSAILTGPPSIDLQFWTQSLDEATTELQGAVDQFGLRRSAVADWTGEIDRAESSGSLARVKTPWLETRVGAATLAVQGRYSPEEESAAVSYRVGWIDAGGGRG